MFKKQILVCAFGGVHITQRILEHYFGAHPDGTILFDNQYFKVSVTLRIVHKPEHDLLLTDGDWKSDLPHFPAVVLLSSGLQPGAISECKTLWDSLHNLISEDAIRILFLDGEDMNEKDTFGLVAWGVSRHIEVVNMFLCREDDTDLSVRVKKILECAPWPITSDNVTQREENIQESLPKPAIRDEIRERPMANRSLLKPTLLRRGLQQSDLTTLVVDILLADENDSDT